jgi:4-alpha-glucanotransferase
MARLSGVTIPLFSIRTRTDWGIGQITDLPACAQFFARAGQRLVQVLPTQELADGETSPYGALSAFALDPIYIDVERVADVDAALVLPFRPEIEQLRAKPAVDYRAVRALKKRALGALFDRFRERELVADGPRKKAFDAFVAREAGWLRDHALYAALRASHAGYGWATWPERERDRDPSLLAVAAAPKDDDALGTSVLEQMYLQWIAHEQWHDARSELERMGVLLMGDMPFVVGSESADVWAHRDQFRRDVTLGAPPDDFAPEGQSWGLPAYDWTVMDKNDFAWLRSRAKHAADLFDRFRIDHVVGFFRQWVKGEGAPAGAFDPPDEKDQKAHGESVLRAMLDAAGEETVIAEDLGVIPDFVRETMGRLGLPGYKVLPWERDDFIPRDPRAFPPRSVATWSTHDTQPITQWWYDLEDWERERIAKIDGIALDAPEHDRELALIKLLFSSSSELTLLLAQEILGDKSRINTPGTVNDANWTWRMTRPIEELRDDASVGARLDAIAQLASAAKRI